MLLLQMKSAQDVHRRWYCDHGRSRQLRRCTRVCSSMFSRPSNKLCGQNLRASDGSLFLRNNILHALINQARNNLLDLLCQLVFLGLLGLGDWKL